MSLSLAPLRYRNIFSKDGGPVERLWVTETPVSGSCNGFQAAAFLAPHLIPSWHLPRSIYGDVQGSGTHVSRSVACHIALSEAVERWAFFAESRGPRRTEFGFDVEQSTTGMAAFPGITKRPARTHAYLEAVERWSILEWWLGRLSAQMSADSAPETGRITLRTPFEDAAVVIVWNSCPFGGLAYGFAAGVAEEEAARRARVEQDRNVVVLSDFFRKTGVSPDEYPLRELQVESERRLIFFSGKKGSALFWDKIRESQRRCTAPVMPRCLVDVEIPGAWTRYATVWRVLYEQSRHDSPTQEDVFLF